MYPLSDVCFTVHVILKVSNNTVQPSPIARLRVKDFFFLKRLQSNHIEILVLPIFETGPGV